MKEKYNGPRYQKLINPTFIALRNLGNSGSNDEIHNFIIKYLNLSNEVVDYIHLDTNFTELQYQLAWARTYLKKYGVITNSERAIWSINSSYSQVNSIDSEQIIKTIVENNKIQRELKNKKLVIENDNNEIIENEFIEEIMPWERQLYEELVKMDPYAFERLSQRLLREIGFNNVNVTKKSGDGGIDGFGQFKMNGILSFKIAFQCKRYTSSVSTSEIRDFRGSLTTDIEKAIFITTSTFTKTALEEAITPGKLRIDLIDGEEFIELLRTHKLGIIESKHFVVDKEFFKSI